MANITRTFLRSDETMTRYMKTMKEREEKGVKFNQFLSNEKKVIKEFEYWIIIDNEFPYDAVATTSHMIATKREVAFDWKLLTIEEDKELEKLQREYLNEHYDVIWENLPKGQTAPGHFHLHLLILKREQI